MVEGDELYVIDDIEYAITDEEAPWCDGGQGALGHPREFLIFETKSQILVCGYCSRRFVHRSNPLAEDLRRRAEEAA